MEKQIHIYLSNFLMCKLGLKNVGIMQDSWKILKGVPVKNAKIVTHRIGRRLRQNVLFLRANMHYTAHFRRREMMRGQRERLRLTTLEYCIRTRSEPEFSLSIIRPHLRYRCRIDFSKKQEHIYYR